MNSQSSSRSAKTKCPKPVLITPAEAKRNQANKLVVDVQPQKFITHTIPGARRLNIDISLEDIEKGQPILLICLTGQRSLKAATQLINRGYRQVYVLKGGLAAWQSKKYTVQPTRRSA